MPNSGAKRLRKTWSEAYVIILALSFVQKIEEYFNGFWGALNLTFAHFRGEK